jgi:lipoprotein-anchoring transpeptidase ErfK/SrfK
MAVKKKLLISGLIGGALLVGAVGGAYWSSQVFAGGTTLAQVDVSYLTPATAAEKVESELAAREVAFTAGEVSGTLRGEALEPTAPYTTIAEGALADHRLLTHLFGNPSNVSEPFSYTSESLEAAVFAAASETQAQPVDAIVGYSEGSYRVEGGTAGALASPEELEAAFIAGTPTVEVPLLERAPTYTAEAAQGAADRLNGVLSTAGFYVEDERLIELSPDELASWITVTPENGEFTVTVDEAAVQARTEKLTEEVDRTAVSGERIVNAAGDVLKTLAPSNDGYKLTSTEGLPTAVAEAVRSGSGTFQLTAERTAATPRTVQRELEVNLTEQKLYFKENGQVVNTMLVSTGLGDSTPEGRFEVFAHVPKQNMGCVPGYDYCTKDVPWVVYFAPDIAFHGAYWHNNFGQRMSHGCVNLPVEQARYVYDWTQTGTDVWVHS